MPGPFFHNEFGTWCPCCGEHLSSDSEDFDEDGECRTCGFPDDIDKITQFHCSTGEDDDDE